LGYPTAWHRINSVRAAAEKTLGACDCGIRCNSEGRVAGAGVDPAADEVIVVTDTYEHADRLQSYQRVAGVATMIEVKPSAAVGL
jgi:hypothetical protein